MLIHLTIQFNTSDNDQEAPNPSCAVIRVALSPFRYSNTQIITSTPTVPGYY